MYCYKLFGLQPGFSDGLVFYSCVHDLQSHPDLWLDECPYIQPQLCARVPEGLRVELVWGDDRTVGSMAMQAQRSPPAAAQAV